MTSKTQVWEFLDQRKIAVVGVSRNKRKFGNSIYHELKKKGYTLYPVNPGLIEVEGDKCYPSVSSLPAEVTTLIISVSPDKTPKVVEEARDSGIKKIWIQRGSHSAEAVKFCEENNIDVVSGECILMFAEPAMFIHRAHRWIHKVSGNLPV